MRCINLNGSLSVLVLFFLMLTGPIVPVKAYALVPEAERALTWLAGHQNQEGYWGNKNKLRDTCAVIAAYDSLDVSGEGHARALDLIINASPESNDYRARRVGVLQSNGINVETELLQIGLCQNQDGGWGYACGYESSVYDTALTLYEMRADKNDNFLDTSRAIAYLLSKQNPDGSWSGSQDFADDIKPTALAVATLKYYGDYASVRGPIDNAVAWLLTKQVAGGGFGLASATVDVTYYVISALMDSGNLNQEILQNAINFLKTSQLTDGSWDGNGYSTAMALHLFGLLAPNASVLASDIVLPDNTLKSGQIVPIQASIKNLGGVEITGLEVQFFVQADNQDPVQIGETATIATLSTGESKVATIDFATQDRLGNCKIIVRIDPANAIHESNENDNQAAADIAIVAAPDLAIFENDVELSANSTTIGADVTIAATVTNIGNYHAENITLKFFKNAVMSENLIGSANIAYLQSGQQESRQVTWKADQVGAAIAIYTVVDPDSVIDEATRDNNQIVKAVEVLSIESPNLTISHHDIAIVPEVGLQGQSIDITAKVTNDGFAAASTIDVDIYLGNPDGGGVLLNSVQIDTLSAGEAQQIAYTWSNIQVHGDHTIFFIIDAANTIEEFNEQDNEAFANLDILSYPDLALSGSAIFFDPPMPKEGDTVTINVLVQNAGQQVASNVDVEAILDGQTIGTTKLAGIPAGSQTVAQFNVDTHDKLGAHEIAVQIDPQNSIAEINEDNNQASRSFGVQDADLWLTESYLSPNGDGVKDSTQFFFRLETPQSVAVKIINEKDEIVRTFTGGDLDANAGGMIAWDGKDQEGQIVLDGQYRIALQDLNGNELGSLNVTVDNNRSPLNAAIGTPYLTQNMLSCNLPDFQDEWQWFPDESGIVFFVETTDPDFPKYPSGLYTMSPDGSDVVRIVPPEWTVGIDPVYDYYIGTRYAEKEFSLSPDGNRVAFVLSKMNRSTRRNELTQLWITDRYGENMVLIDSLDVAMEPRNSTSYFSGDILWSPDGSHLAYTIWKRNTQNFELWVATDDGSKKTRIDASEEFSYNNWIGILQWSFDSKKLAYQISRPAPSNYYSPDYKLNIYDADGQIQSIFDIGYYYLYRDYTFFWLTDASVVVLSGNNNEEKLWMINLDNPTQPIMVSDQPNADELKASPRGGHFSYIENKAQTASIFMGNEHADVILLHEHDCDSTGGEGGYYCSLPLPPVWAPDGSKLAFGDAYHSQLLVVDAQTLSKETFPISGPNVDDLHFFMDNNIDVLMENEDGYFLMNTHNGGQSDYLPIPKWYGASPAISPLAKYMTYNKQYDNTEQCLFKGYESLWTLGSLLNLTADLRAVKNESAITLKGIAADLNFSDYVLEYADDKDPQTWNLVAPPSDVPVVNDVFATWVPPYDGIFLLRLTVNDYAGNQKIVEKRISWGAASSITNIYTDEKFISPNGDGVQDSVTLNYQVVRPVNLEFLIYDNDDNLVTSFYRSHQEPGSYQLLWDGRDATGAVVEDAEYRIAIFDQNFKVEVDTKPPEAEIFLDGIEVKQEYPSWLEVDTQYYMDLFCRARDNHLKVWNLAIGEGDSPQEWSDYRTGTISLAFAVTDPEGTVTPTPTETFNDPQFLVNKKIKITVQDYAGNTSTRVSDFSEQRIRFHSWRVPGYGGVIYGFFPSRFLPPCPCIHGFQIVDGLHDLMAAETIRAPIEAWVVQTREFDGEWLDMFESGPGASGENTIHWGLAGLTSDEVDQVRIKAVTDSGEIFYSNIAHVLKPGDGGDGNPEGPDLPGGGCELPPMKLSVEHLPASACDSVSTMAVVDVTQNGIDGKDEQVELLRKRLTDDGFAKLAYYIQVDGTRQLLQALDIATAQAFNIFIDKSAFQPGRYALIAAFERQGRSCELTDSIEIEPTLPSAEIFSPKTSDIVCPIVDGTKRYVQITGQAEKLNGIKSYRLDYGFGPTPDSWHTIVVRQDGSPTSQLGMWEVTNLPNGVFALRLTVTDNSGNVSCFQTGEFQIFYEKVNLTAPQAKILFSPSIGPADFVYSSTNTGLTIDATVFQGDTYIRSLAAGSPIPGGEGEVQWDGRDHAGVIVADGLYRVDITATNTCGASKTVRREVEVDNTPPVTVISHPLSANDLGTMVEVSGTATDKYFASYRLEAIGLENRLIKNGQVEVRDDILGVWSTYGLSGDWTLKLTARDQAGNEGQSSVQLDFSQKTELLEDLRAAPRLFSPNNDGTSDFTTLTYNLIEDCSVSITLADANQNPVRQYADTLTAGTHTFQWDGTDDHGAVVADGLYDVAFTATLSSDPALTQTERITVQVDTTLPAIEILQPADRAYINGDFSVFGSITDDHIANYSLSYIKDNQTTVVDQGNQNRTNHFFAGPKNLSEGAYEIVVEATDQAGNQSQHKLTCTVDKTPPKIDLSSPADQSIFGSDQSMVNFEGTIEEQNIDHWKIRYATQSAPDQWMDLIVSDQLPDGPMLYAWNVANGSGVLDGLYNFSFYAVDKAGSESQVRIDIRVDNTPPVVEIAAPADSASVKQAIAVQGTVTDDNLQQYKVELSAGECDGAFEWQEIFSSNQPVENGDIALLQALPLDGPHCLRVTAVDKIGHSTTAQRSIVVDTTPPNAPVLTGEVLDSIHAALSWTANTESDLAGYRIYRDSQPITAQIISATHYQDSDLSDGVYSFTVTAVDQAGWESKPSNIVKLKIDTIAPNVRIASPQEGIMVNNLVDISGTAYSREDFKEYRVYTGAGANPDQWILIRTSPLATAYGTLAAWNTLGLAEGTYSLRVEAEDLTGNKADHQVVVHLDNTPPTAPVLLTAVQDGQDIHLTWQASAETDVRGYLIYRNDQLANLDGLVIGDLSPYLIGSTSYTDSGLADGTFAYYVVAMDQAGNTSAPSNALSVALDNHSPSASITIPQDGHQFDAKLLVKAESADTDIAAIQFQYKRTSDAAWLEMGEAVTARPFVNYLDPAALNLTYDQYQLRAVATDEGGHTDSAPGFISLVYTDLSAPAAPQDLYARTNSREVTLAWTANTESDLAGYNLYQITGEMRLQLNQTLIEENRFTLSELDDALYVYEVTAVDASGNESRPGIPAKANVYAPEIAQPYTPTADTLIPLTGSSPVLETTVGLFLDSGAGPVSIGVHAVDAQGDFSFDVSLAPGENRIIARATDEQGNISRDSEAIVVVSNQAPESPTGLTAEVTDHTVHLAWNANGEGDIEGYNLYRDGVKLNGATPVTEGAAAAASAFTWNAGRAVDGDPNTSWSGYPTEAGATQWWQLTLPSKVLIGRVEIDWLGGEAENHYAAKAYEIQFWSGYAWIPAVKVSANDQRSNVHEFQPYYATDQLRIVLTEAFTNDAQKMVGFAEVRVWKENPISQPEFDDIDVANGEYAYTVTAVDHYGFESPPSAEAPAVVGDVVPPEAPQNLTATAVDANVVLTWQPNSEPDLDGYHVYKRTGETWSRLTGAPIAETTYTQSNIVNGNHTYRVAAVDTSDNLSAPSNQADATVAIAPPPIPTGLSITSIPEGNALEICWQPSAGIVAGYNLYRGTTSGGPYEKINQEPITEACYLDADLVNGQPYFYFVVAVDAIGNESAQTSEGSAVPADSVAPGRPLLLYPTLPGMPLSCAKDSVQVSGLAEPGAAVRIYKESHLAGETSALAEDRSELFEIQSHIDTAAISPDGKHLAYASNDAIWLYDLATGDETQVAPEGFAPVWSPDGNTLAYGYRDQNWNDKIYLYNLETQQAALLIDAPDTSVSSPSWTRDGTLIAFQRSGSPDLQGIWIKDFVTGSQERVVEDWQAASPLLSPDGRWLAYNEYGTLYVLDRHDGSVVQLDTALYRYGRSWLAWSPDSSRLAFLSNTNGPADLYIVEMETLERRRLSETDTYIFAVDWTPDGQSLSYAERTLSADQVWLAAVDGQADKSLLKETGRNDLRYLACTEAGHFVYLDNQTLERQSPAGLFTLDDLLLDPGQNPITARAIDSSQNASQPSDEILLLLDPESLPDLETTAQDIFIYPAVPITGQEAALSVLVWNHGAVAAKDVKVEIYIRRSDGNLDMAKSEIIARIDGNSNELVTLSTDDLGSPGENAVYVSIDPADAIHELSENNNNAQKTFQVAENKGINLFAGLNGDAFDSNSEVQIDIDLLNNGPDAEGTLEVFIVDADGATIANLQTTHETLAFGTQQHYPLVWDTGATQAGRYYLYAFFRDSEDLIAEKSFAFDILPDMDIDVGLVTNKAHYGPDENVVLEVALANLGVNHTVDRLDLLVTIARAETVLHTEEKTALNLLPQTRQSYQFVWNSGPQQPGEYTVRLQVVHNTDVIASPVKTFLIDSALVIGGEIKVSPRIVAPGQTISADYTISVSGNTAVPELPMRILVIDPDSALIVDTHSQTISMASNGEQAGQVVFATQDLALKSYMVALQCDLQGQTHHLGQSGFTVKDLLAPQFEVVAPAAGTTYTGPIDLQVTAQDDITGVQSVEYRIDEGPWLALPLANPGSGQYAAVWTPDQADQGGHTIEFRATDLAGNVSQVTALQIQIDLQNAFEKLTGTLSTAPDPIYQGQQLQLIYAIGNPTSQAIERFAVRGIISDPATGQVLATLERTTAIDGQTTLSGNFDTSTADLAPQSYRATLVVEAAGTGAQRTLAEADFELLPAVEATRQIVDKASILVWVNDLCHRSPDSHHLDDNGSDETSAWQDAQDDTGGEKDRHAVCDALGSDTQDDASSEAALNNGPECEKPDPNQKRCVDVDLLERVLDQSAWQYHIVYDRSDFEAELRSPFYTDILILGDAERLRPQSLAELAERVHAGAGLISSLWVEKGAEAYGSCGKDKKSMFGVQWKGHLPGDAHPLITLQSPITAEGAISAIGKAVRVRADEATTLAGWIASESKCGDWEQVPAIVLNEYGQGRTVYFAFDLGLTLGQDNLDQMAQLLADSIAFVHKPLDVDQLRPFQAVPMQMEIKAMGTAVDTRITESFDEPFMVYDPLAEQWIAQSPWISQLHLEPGETRKVIYYYLAPDIAGVFQTLTQISLGSDSDAAVLQTFSNTFHVVQDSQVRMENILSKLDAIEPAKTDRPNVKKARKLVESVLNRGIYLRRAIGENIAGILKAIAFLRCARQTDFTPVRYQLDEVLIIQQGMYHLFATDAWVSAYGHAVGPLAHLRGDPLNKASGTPDNIIPSVGFDPYLTMDDFLPILAETQRRSSLPVSGHHGQI